MWFSSRWVSPALSIKTGSIFITMGSTTRCILLRGTGTRVLLTLNSPPLPHPPQIAQNGKRGAQESALWMTDSMTGCLHLHCTVKKLRLLRCHTLPPLLPFSLPPRLGWGPHTDSCLQGHSVVCNPKPQANTSVWTTLFYSVFEFPRTLSLSTGQINQSRMQEL